MAANNPAGAAAAAAGNNRQPTEHVEFSVKAAEDLYLTGSETTIRRVTAETNYSCLMLKSQRFSSLFRHYAKYHGLRKDELEYYFVNLLENEDTPESVQLQRGDVILVRKKRTPELLPKLVASDKEFRRDMRYLLDDDEHCDATFLLHDSTKIRAHKSMLTARTDYFKALFRHDTFRESRHGVVTVEPDFTADHVRSVLSFVYYNRVPRLEHAGTDELLALWRLADQWLLPRLQQRVELELAQHHVSDETVVRLFRACDDLGASPVLTTACADYIAAHLPQLLPIASTTTSSNNNNNTPATDLTRLSPALTLQILKRTAAAEPPAPMTTRHTHNNKRVRRSSPVVPDTQIASSGVGLRYYDV